MAGCLHYRFEPPSVESEIDIVTPYVWIAAKNILPNLAIPSVSILLVHLPYSILE